MSSTVAPASSSLALAASASSLDRPSLMVAGAPSTAPLASFKPRPVISRTALITLTFLSPAAVRTTSNSVCSSATSPPAAGPAITAAAAETPNFSSIASISSTTSITVMSATALMISSLDSAIVSFLTLRESRSAEDSGFIARFRQRPG
ncbi:hypothetical protein HALTITAN_2653 [Vreelandella titanicae BH1]|uniref:50S ribosomal protein L7/L12 n=1 Tax=Vreelandella titanicae BH1 TaxID=1204738 RepID=L9U709_9GAMM|nr:hypothetical protein HALTITAN_2653 [Halomonas titanicae BH1]